MEGFVSHTFAASDPGKYYGLTTGGTLEAVAWGRTLPTRYLLGLLMSACCLVCGCTGSATIHTMPFLRNDFPATEPPARSIQANEAYWWVDEYKRVNVAIRRYVPSLLGKLHEYDWQMSLAVEDLPAGSEKLYNMGVDSVRQHASYGGAHQRAISLTGVVVLHAPKDGVLRGRFHADVRQQQFNVLTGWVPPMNRSPLIVLAGTFEAVHDPMRGQAIRDQTEANGLARGNQLDLASRTVYMLHPLQSRPATQPVSQPTTASSSQPIISSTRPTGH